MLNSEKHWFRPTNNRFCQQHFNEIPVLATILINSQLNIFHISKLYKQSYLTFLIGSALKNVIKYTSMFQNQLTEAKNISLLTWNMNNSCAITILHDMHRKILDIFKFPSEVELCWFVWIIDQKQSSYVCRVKININNGQQLYWTILIFLIIICFLIFDGLTVDTKTVMTTRSHNS